MLLGLCLLNLTQSSQKEKGRVLDVETTVKAVKNIRMHVSLENLCRLSLLANGWKDEKRKFMFENFDIFR